MYQGGDELDEENAASFGFDDLKILLQDLPQVVSWLMTADMFEGVLTPVDWGIKTVKGGNAPECVKKAHVILDMFQPSVLVLQDCSGQLSRCSGRVKKQIQALVDLCTKKGTRVRQYSRADVRACFSSYGAVTKEEIAREVVKQLPEFAPKVPPMRRLWMSEDY